jgi:hypothetical protein
MKLMKLTREVRTLLPGAHRFPTYVVVNNIAKSFSVVSLFALL